jgi:hypothetical protein
VLGKAINNSKKSLILIFQYWKFLKIRNIFCYLKFGQLNYYFATAFSSSFCVKNILPSNLQNYSPAPRVYNFYLQTTFNPFFQPLLTLTTRGITKEFPRNTPSILSPGEFPFLKDSRGIPWESIEKSFLFPGIFAKKVELLRNSPGIPCGTKEVHKCNSN